eukprot:TCALIF_13261-PA protein Name:"Protein of unknown function" AED:0.31 eAED:0.31 QI:0/0.33/0.5/0.5/0.66/0.75/4/0/123
MTMTKEFQCYTCEENGMMIECGSSTGTLRTCSKEFHYCITVQTQNGDQNKLFKGCFVDEEANTFNRLDVDIKDSLESVIGTPARPEIRLDGCLDVRKGESEQVHSENLAPIKTLKWSWTSPQG